MKKNSVLIFSILTVLWTRNVTAGDEILDSRRGPVFSGVMKDLSAHSIARRKHYNKHENVTDEQRYIDTVLGDRKRVDVKRYASVEEKDAILQILMASVLINPRHQNLVTHEALKRYESSTDSLDRHFYIVGMTEYFARKLRNQESIERNDYQMFERFSGVDFERFNRLFDAVKIKHMGGFHVELRDRKIEKRKAMDAHYGELSKSYERKKIRQKVIFLGKIAQGSSEEAKKALGEIIENAKSVDSSVQKLAVWQLKKVAQKPSAQAKRALEALTTIANDSVDSLLQRTAVLYLGEVAKGSSGEAKIALREIIEKAQSTDFSLQKWSIFTLFSIARGSSEQAKDALGALAKIAKTLDIVQKRKVVFQLGAIAEDSFVQAKTALDALIALANDTDDKRLQGLSVYQLGSVAEGSSEQAKRALEVLILIANTQGHEQQEYAVFQLGSVLRGSLTQGLAALDALTAIANDPKHAQNEKAVWQFAMGAQSKSPSIVQKARETLSTIARNPTHAQKEAAETELQALN